ncbi:MAG TPA: 2-isopropylmalate synthase [Candidatus Sulfotelmatobacter sp.]|nr:2-isopropylmalate synthase [Candidatus Sulfotelmatobacter sp.]
MEQVKIFDTTLRDGEQSPGCSMTADEKLRMARQLERLGVDVIEAGFPFSSDGDFHSVQLVAREIRRPVIVALARCCQSDIERAWEALKSAAHPRIHIFLATSDIHLQHKLKLSRRECLEQACDAVRFAKSLCEDVEFSPEDATRSDPDFLCNVLRATIEAGATTVNIPDTVGYAVPSEFADLIRTIRRRVPGIEQITISVHCHNDLGLAVANSLAAVNAGARQVECTINGIGERAGNASLEEVVMAMRVRPDRYPLRTSVVSEQLFPASQLLTEVTGVPVQPNKAIIGRNAFAHEAGIHQDGMIKNPLTYEIITPQSVGVPGTNLVLGKHSGRHALGLRREELGFPLERHELDPLYRHFVALADATKIVEDCHILELLRQIKRERSCPSISVESPLASIISSHNAAGHLTHPEPDDRFKGDSGRKASSRALGAHENEQQEDYLWGV